MEDRESAANAAICLINRANFLLDGQIKSAEEKFVKEGGYREKLYRERGEEMKRRISGVFWRKYE